MIRDNQKDANSTDHTQEEESRITQMSYVSSDSNTSFDLAVSTVFETEDGNEIKTDVPVEDEVAPAEEEEEETAAEEVNPEDLEATAAGGGAENSGSPLPGIFNFGHEGQVGSVDSEGRDIDLGEEILDAVYQDLQIPAQPVSIEELGPALLAFDNASIIGNCYCVTQFSFNFDTSNNGSGDSDFFQGWIVSGHEHNINDAAFLSTRNIHEFVTSENVLASFLGLSSSALDEVKGDDAAEGTAMWYDIVLAPGQVIRFDYFFATNDEFESDDNDFAFFSISGQSGEVVYDFADTHSVWNSSNTFIDSTIWDWNTGWNNASFTVPYTWDAGVYRIGFGVIDVGSPNDTKDDSSMLMIDNIESCLGANMVSGNVIHDQNNYIDSEDPLGAVDFPEVGSKVTEIAFEYEGEGVEWFIFQTGLNALGAFFEDGYIIIPIPDTGEYVDIITPQYNHLVINSEGAYRYFVDCGDKRIENRIAERDEGPEVFRYRLEDEAGNFDHALLVITPINADLYKTTYENDRPCINLVIAIDVSDNMNHRLSIAQDAAVSLINQYIFLGYVLDITVIPFSSGSLSTNAYDGALVYHASNSGDAIDYISDLNEGYGPLGGNSEFDDLLNVMQRDVLEPMLQNACEDCNPVVYILTDGDPTSGQGANNAIQDWQTFVDQNEINVTVALIDPRNLESTVTAVEPIGNSGDEPIVIVDSEEIELLLNVVVVPNQPFSFEDCSLLQNVNLEVGGPYEVIRIAVHFNVDDVAAVFLDDLLASYESLSADISVVGNAYTVMIDVPQEGFVDVLSPLGGLLRVERDGDFSYRNPYMNSEEDMEDKFIFTYRDDELDLQANGLLSIVIQDTSPMAYDNAGYISLNRESTFISNFSSTSGWSQSGHTHFPFSFSSNSRAFMSTHDQGSGHNSETSENSLASFLGLDSDTLDDIKSQGAEEGAAIKHTYYLEGGQVIQFDFYFASNDPNEPHNGDNDYAFLSLSGNGREIVYDFIDANSTPNVSNISIDSLTWDGNTGWQTGLFTVPLDWVAGNYVLGFGVVDVGSPSNSSGDASMLMVDNLSFYSSPEHIQGNVNSDPNSDYINSWDPINAVDEIGADGAYVSLISFYVDGSANSYINSHNLDHLVNAYGSGNTVYVPVDEDGVAFQTYFGGYLTIDQHGNYDYAGPFNPEASYEQFTYTLSERDGNDSDTGNLTVYFADELEFDLVENGDKHREFNLSMDIKPSEFLISDLESGDVLNFNDVSDVDDLIGGIDQPDFEDVLNSWVQQGNDVVMQLQNNSVLVLQDVGIVPGSANSDLQNYMQNTMNVELNINAFV